MQVNTPKDALRFTLAGKGCHRILKLPNRIRIIRLTSNFHPILTPKEPTVQRHTLGQSVTHSLHHLKRTTRMIGILLDKTHLVAHLSYRLIGAAMLLAQGLLSIRHEAITHWNTQENGQHQHPKATRKRKASRQFAFETGLVKHLTPTFGKGIQRSRVFGPLLNADQSLVRRHLNPSNWSKISQIINLKITGNNNLRKTPHASKILRLQ